MATPTKLLRVQHMDVVTLFEQIEPMRSTDDRRRAVKRLADEVVAHMIIEERLFYPAALAVDAEMIGHSIEEHQEAQEALVELLRTDAGDPAFSRKLAHLRDLLVHHAEEEERELFPEVEAAWSLRTQSELLVELEDLHAAALEEGHEAILGRIEVEPAPRAERASPRARQGHGL